MWLLTILQWSTLNEISVLWYDKEEVDNGSRLLLRPCGPEGSVAWWVAGRGLGEWRDSFNFWLSHSRQAVERAFGMLVQRWGIFWRPFTFSFERWPLVIILCCKLHNFCLDRNAKIPKRRCDEDHVPGDLPVVYDNNDAVCDIMCSQRSRGSRRQEITDKLEVEGRRRPPHALCNSRQ